MMEMVEVQARRPSRCSQREISWGIHFQNLRDAGIGELAACMIKPARMNGLSR